MYRSSLSFSRYHFIINNIIRATTTCEHGVWRTLRESKHHLPLSIHRDIIRTRVLQDNIHTHFWSISVTCVIGYNSPLIEDNSLTGCQVWELGLSISTWFPLSFLGPHQRRWYSMKNMWSSLDPRLPCPSTCIHLLQLDYSSREGGTPASHFKCTKHEPVYAALVQWIRFLTNPTSK